MSSTGSSAGNSPELIPNRIDRTHLDEPLLTAADVAALLAVPQSSVYEYARRHRDPLPSIGVDRHRRFYRGDVEIRLAAAARHAGGLSREAPSLDLKSGAVRSPGNGTGSVPGLVILGRLRPRKARLSGPFVHRGDRI
jgi:Helix-turn-helix domain